VLFAFAIPAALDVAKEKKFDKGLLVEHGPNALFEIAQGAASGAATLAGVHPAMPIAATVAVNARHFLPLFNAKMATGFSNAAAGSGSAAARPCGQAVEAAAVPPAAVNTSVGA